MVKGAGKTLAASAGFILAVSTAQAGIELTKNPAVQPGGFGDTVRFTICWSNFSTETAFTFVITEAVPLSTTFIPEASTAAFDCGNSTGVSPTTAYSTANSVTPPAAFVSGNPVAGTRWLRWTLPQAGTPTTGCVCYRVTVEDPSPDNLITGRGASATMIQAGVGASVTYSATASVIVTNPGVLIRKSVSPSFLDVAGGNATYTIAFSNGGSNTAYSVTIFDHFPLNAVWQTAGYSAWYVDGTGFGRDFSGSPPSGSAGYSLVAPPPWTAGTPANGMNVSSAYMQWVVPSLAIGRSGMITFVFQVF